MKHKLLLLTLVVTIQALLFVSVAQAQASSQLNPSNLVKQTKTGQEYRTDDEISAGNGGNGCSHLNATVRTDEVRPVYINNYNGWAYVGCRIGARLVDEFTSMGKSWMQKTIGVAISQAIDDVVCEELKKHVYKTGFELVRIFKGYERKYEVYKGKPYESTNGDWICVAKLVRTYWESE